MKIFTLQSGKFSEGASVSSYELSSGIAIPTVQVGEKGRGRKLAFLPVALLPETKRDFDAGKRVEIQYCEIGETRKGTPKLIETATSSPDCNECLCVFRTPIGFRGGNSHTGDREETFYLLQNYYRGTAEKIGCPIKGRYTLEEAELWGRKIYAAKDGDNSFSVLKTACFDKTISFAPFPGKIIAEGMIAQGMAGAMGSGTQLIAVMPKDKVFRTGYSGRMYGAPTAHYYIFDGNTIISATWEEREASDIF